MNGSIEHVPRTIVELVAVGEGITHAFTMCNIFPFKHVKAP